MVNNRKLSETVSLTEEQEKERHYKVRDVVERRRKELRKIDHSH